MRAFVPVCLAAAFATAPVAASFAADSAQPLQPGKPAGVKQAQMENNVLTIAFGAGLLAAGIIIATTGGNGSGTAATTTTGTSP